jgi:hypothetical protein
MSKCDQRREQYETDAQITPGYKGDAVTELVHFNFNLVRSRPRKEGRKLMNTSKRSTVRTFLSVSVLLSFLMLSTAWFAPVAARADNDNKKQQQNKRYYDEKNHDSHEWNDNENRAYRSYLQENHQEYRDFSKVKAPQQQAYFGWRHEHPDSVLFKLDIR